MTTVEKIDYMIQSLKLAKRLLRSSVKEMVRKCFKYKRLVLYKEKQ